MSALMEKMDRIFDAPVEYADRKLKMPNHIAESNMHYYERYVAGIHWMEASGFMIVGGLAAAAAGVEAGGATAVLSVGLAYFGGLKTMINNSLIER